MGTIYIGVMRVIGRGSLFRFHRQHADARSAIEAWLAEAEGADWQSPQDIRERYPSASFLKGNHVIFNLRGNEYRLEVQVSYNVGVVTVKNIGTHAEYDRWKR
jgi:mRNA interferase HigB